MIDYHCHTKLCRHATGTIQEYTQQAKKLNLSGIGFSDHFPMVYMRRFFYEATADVPYEDYSMTFQEIPIYVQMIKTLRSQFQTNAFEIKLGLELDYTKDHDDEVRTIISPYIGELDYIYGSIHFLYLDDKIFPFDDSRFIKIYEKISIDNLHELYFESINKMIQSGIYDIVAHFDLLKKFNIRPKNKQRYREIMEETLSLLQNSGMALEINTAGLRKPVNEIYPEKFILEMCHDKGIPVLLGLDSHQPEEVGHAFDQACALLKEVGYSQHVNFEKRQKKFSDLPP